MGDSGYKSLSRAEWGRLKEIWLSYICGYVDRNEVGEKGCRHLSKAALGELEEI